MKDILLGLLRHALTLGGGVLIEQGLASQADTTAILGGIAALVGVVASILNKKKVSV